MKIDVNDPPRVFYADAEKEYAISDCGKVHLEPEEQVSFVTANGKEYDFVAKPWGYYASPSINHRLRNEGFKTALVKSVRFNRHYIMAVDDSMLDEFDLYLEATQQEVAEWLDERV